MGLLKSVAKYGILPAVILGNLATAALEKVTKKEYGRTTPEEAAQTTIGKILGVSTLAAGAAAGIAYSPAAALKIATKAVPKTALGKGAALVITGAALASPKITSAVLEAPFTLVESGKKIGKAAEELPEITQEEASGLGKYGLIGAGIAALGTGLITGAVLESKAIAKEAGGMLESVTPPVQELPAIATEDVETPLTYATEEPEQITGTTPKKRRKKRLQPQGQHISQRVDVRVGVNAANRKYIKNEIHN
jgi:hypothetical protein